MKGAQRYQKSLETEEWIWRCRSQKRFDEIQLSRSKKSRNFNSSMKKSGTTISRISTLEDGSESPQINRRDTLASSLMRQIEKNVSFIWEQSDY